MGLLLIAGTFVAYLPVWQAGFIMDDEFWVGNSLIRRADGWYRFWCTTEAPDYFPVTSTLMWLEWRLWGGNPLGYHVVNVLLHAFGAVLLWRVLARLKIPGAWLAAAIFALHPVNVESVAWISERKNVLAMVFYAFALLAYLRHEDADRRVEHACVLDTPEAASPSAFAARQSAAAARRRLALSKSSKLFRWIGTALSRRGGTVAPIQAPRFSEWRWYAAALGAFVLGLLSKAAVAPLPVVLLGLAWWRRGRVQQRDIWRCVPFFIVAALLSLVTVWFQYHESIGSAIVRSDSIWSRLAGAGCAVWFYLYKAVLPVDLCFVYPRWQIDAADPIAYAPGVLAAAGLLLCWRHRRRWGKAWLFALGYFVVVLLPVLGFINISFMRYSLVADRWQYFAIPGVIALAAAGATRWLNSKTRMPTLVGGVLLVALGAQTWSQCLRYRDAETLWQTTLARNPACFLAHNNLGAILLDRSQTEAALAHFEKALEIQPAFADAHVNVGCVLFRKGRTEQALARFRRAVRIQPDLGGAYFNSGNVLLQMGRLDEAIREYHRALEVQPGFPDLHCNLGKALLLNGQFGEAIRQFQTVLEPWPDHVEARYNLGNALLQNGQPDQAIRHFEKALEIQPDHADARYNLGTLLAHEGRVNEAAGHLQKLLALQPNDADAHNNLANALLQMARVDEAKAHYQRAAELRPDDAQFQSNLARIKLHPAGVRARLTGAADASGATGP